MSTHILRGHMPIMLGLFLSLFTPLTCQLLCREGLLDIGSFVSLLILGGGR